uniref:Uncharacterized protein n=1 Tax=Anopheles epiroticus TaxID=199890 RepID=A0A182PWU5_9DIPT
MDDVLSGASSIEAAIEAQRELKQLLGQGGFPIHKWCSNSSQFLEQIPETEREKGIPNLDRAVNETIKVLGVSWDPNSDTLSIAHHPIPSHPQPVTKRMLYATIAKMFDPLGLVSPVLVLAKLLTQRLWKNKIDWDEPVDEPTSQEWQFRNQQYLNDVNEFCHSREIEWHFIPPDAPEFGGLWEAAVKSAKNHLKRVVGNVNLTFEELTTILVEIEAVLNSRTESDLHVTGP